MQLNKIKKLLKTDIVFDSDAYLTAVCDNSFVTKSVDFYDVISKIMKKYNVFSPIIYTSDDSKVVVFRKKFVNTSAITTNFITCFGLRLNIDMTDPGLYLFNQGHEVLLPQLMSEIVNQYVLTDKTVVFDPAGILIDNLGNSFIYETGNFTEQDIFDTIHNVKDTVDTIVIDSIFLYMSDYESLMALKNLANDYNLKVICLNTTDYVPKNLINLFDVLITGKTKENLLTKVDTTLLHTRSSVELIYVKNESVNLIAPLTEYSEEQLRLLDEIKRLEPYELPNF